MNSSNFSDHQEYLWPAQGLASILGEPEAEVELQLFKLAQRKPRIIMAKNFPGGSG